MTSTSKPKIIFHIGMGKTGTTSVQKALDDSAILLARQSVKYLGMWFDFERPSFTGVKGTRDFFSLDASELFDLSGIYADTLMQEHRNLGFKRFIFSNEQIFAHFDKALEFIGPLRENFEVEVVCMIRHPSAWLPSAHSQWGIKNKTYSGQIRSLKEFSRDMIARYQIIESWAAAFEDSFKLVNLSKGSDVIQAFKDICGVELESLGFRSNERNLEAEILLRAMFNDRISIPASSKVFDDTIGLKNMSVVGRMDELIQKCFEFDNLEELMTEHQHVWSFLSDNFSIDFSKLETAQPSIDRDELYKGIVERLVWIIFSQADRLTEVERRLEGR